MSKAELMFVRLDKCNLDAIALVSFEFTGQGEPLDALKQAVTAWVSETEDGKSCWEASSEDLNIGDLLNAAEKTSGPKTLQRYLKTEGITRMHMRGLALNGGDQVSYDEHLVEKAPF